MFEIGDQWVKTNRPLNNQINQFSWKMMSLFIKDPMWLRARTMRVSEEGKSSQTDKPLSIYLSIFMRMICPCELFQTVCTFLDFKMSKLSRLTTLNYISYLFLITPKSVLDPESKIKV